MLCIQLVHWNLSVMVTLVTVLTGCYTEVAAYRGIRIAIVDGLSYW